METMIAKLDLQGGTRARHLAVNPMSMEKVQVKMRAREERRSSLRSMPHPIPFLFGFISLANSNCYLFMQPEEKASRERREAKGQRAEKGTKEGTGGDA